MVHSVDPRTAQSVSISYTVFRRSLWYDRDIPTTPEGHHVSYRRTRMNLSRRNHSLSQRAPLRIDGTFRLFPYSAVASRKLHCLQVTFVVRPRHAYDSVRLSCVLRTYMSEVILKDSRSVSVDAAEDRWYISFTPVQRSRQP